MVSTTDLRLVGENPEVRSVVGGQRPILDNDNTYNLSDTYRGVFFFYKKLITHAITQCKSNKD